MWNRPKLDFMAGEVRRHLSPGATMLEVGLGEGYCMEQMARGGYRVFGLDISSYIIEYLRRKFSDQGLEAELCVGSLDAIPYPDGAFDAVMAFDILEHVGENVFERGLEEIKRVLRPGGLFFGTLPIDENLSEGMVSCPKCAHEFHRIGHCISFNEESAREAIERHFTLRQLREIPYRRYTPFMRFGFWGLKFLRPFMPAEVPTVLKMYTAYFVATHS